MATQSATWRQQAALELDDFAHGAAGGFLFGVPLVYTMEMWFIGQTVSMGHALLLLLLSFLLSLAFVVTIGFRHNAPLRFRDVLIESIDAIGISLVVTMASLAVLGRIGPGVSVDVFVGRVAVELLPVSLGVAVANHILPLEGNRQREEADRDAKSHANPTLRDLVAAGGGALLLSLNIAPTEEVTILAGELREVQLIGLMLFSLVVTYGIVFEAGFRNQHIRLRQQGLLQTPLTETVVAYLVALLVCGGIMWLVGVLPTQASIGVILGKVIVLGFPGSLGAAAGRLAV